MGTEAQPGQVLSSQGRCAKCQRHPETPQSQPAAPSVTGRAPVTPGCLVLAPLTLTPRHAPPGKCNPWRANGVSTSLGKLG